jgi:HB1, ASXL, restriction endonuclease HTH domain
LRPRGSLVAAPPHRPTDEEKEATTMAKAKRGESAKQVARDVLSNAGGGPLPAKEIAKRVIESGRCKGLKGKTPEATITAMLAVGSKPGGPFKRVDKGTYALAEQPTNGGKNRGEKNGAKDTGATDTATKDAETKDGGASESGRDDAQPAEAEGKPGKQRQQPTQRSK